MPEFDGTRASYVEFVVIGLCLNMTVLLLLHELSRALRNEQLTGTLESLLVTPTGIGTVQLGSTLFNLLYVPLRLGLFLAVIAIVFGLDLHADGILPASVLTLEFLPFLWGIGLIAAGAVLRFRRGAGAIGTGVAVVGLASGAFFPLSVLPSWLAHLDAYNPLAIVLSRSARCADRRGRLAGACDTYLRAPAADALEPGGRDPSVPVLSAARAAARNPRALLT